MSLCFPLQERSDDEESDHTPDPYTSHMRGRVSPSPYTVNTERARMFNVSNSLYGYLNHPTLDHVTGCTGLLAKRKCILKK